MSDDAARLVQDALQIAHKVQSYMPVYFGGYWNSRYNRLPYVFIDDTVNVMTYEIRPVEHNQGRQALTDKRMLFNLVAGLLTDDNNGYTHLLASAGAMALAHELNDMERHNDNSQSDTRGHAGTDGPAAMVQ